MIQGSSINSCSDFATQFSFPEFCSATEGMQVHPDLLPGAHHADGGVQASCR